MTPALTDFVPSIVAAHELATEALRGAVAHAVQAGELLLNAKAAAPHGTFGSFCATLPFSPTTARGYMRLARLDPENRQRVADLPLRAALLEIAEARPAKNALSAEAALMLEPGMDPPPPTSVTWTPAAGHWHIGCTKNAAFHVVPSLEFPGRFHVSKLHGSECHYTRNPIRAAYVENFLLYLGHPKPHGASWHTSPNAGMSEPFGWPAAGGQSSPADTPRAPQGMCS
jgi:hypothetical protein